MEKLKNEVIKFLKRNLGLCSIDHQLYESGIAASIKYDYYLDHIIRCPECGKVLED